MSAEDDNLKERKVHERHVVLLGFDGFQPLDLVGPHEVFVKANSHTLADTALYRITLASPAGGDIRTPLGLCISNTAAIEDLTDGIDTLLVSGGQGEGLRRAAENRRLISWLGERAADVRRIGSICTGAHVLAAAGLLRGRRATTHWASCADLRAAYPDIIVIDDAIFVVDGHVHTSAGVTSGIDLALALIEQDLGSAVALAVARDLVLPLRRSGGQSQFSPSLAAQARATDRFRDLIVWIVQNSPAEITVATLADRVGMSERHFARVFRSQTGITPALFVERARVDRAKALLDSSDWPLARIAEATGFGGVSTLLRAFRRNLGISPKQYRKCFGSG